MYGKCGRYMEGKKRVVPREVCMKRSERSNHCTRKRGGAEHAEVSRGHSSRKDEGPNQQEFQV